ncbi:MAG: outer membrane lipoprotein-sorting protein [bacterium]
MTRDDARDPRYARLATAAFLVALLVLPTLADAQPSADELLVAAENSVFPDSFVATVVLTTTEDGEAASEMELEISYRHETGSYMEVVAPARSRGLRFLQIEETLWMYNPRAGGGRAIRLSPRSSFQGSAFSNRDLSDPEFADDYDARIDGSEEIEHPELGRVDCWVLEATATDDSLAYARIRVWVTEETRYFVRAEYYAKSGLLFKSSVLRGIERLAGARRPTVIEMRNRQREGLVSTMEITEMEVADDLPDRVFTQRHLTR